MKHKLYAPLAAGCGALALLAAANSSALAFDQVNWIWNADVATSVNTVTNALTDLTPTGLNQTENSQETYGSVTANSNINGFTATLDPNLTGPSPTTDLPRIETSAQSMGNTADISSDVQTQYDSMQTFAGVDPATAGSIEAHSTANQIVNASVDSSAIGVANNLIVDLAYASAQDALAIGNNVQSAIVNVNTSSTVDTVGITGFSDLGSLGTPAVMSAATSVGNNFSIDMRQASPPN